MTTSNRNINSTIHFTSPHPLIDKTREFARARHAGQLDDAGLSYFDAHIQQVVAVLRLVTDDVYVLAAAYLHDTLEDTATTYDELVAAFGLTVADLVHEVTHEGKKDSYGYYFPRLHSRQAILIKFADRLSNLSRMADVWDERRQASYLKSSRFWRDDKNNDVLAAGEALVKAIGGCTCAPDYAQRGLEAPDCIYHRLEPEIEDWEKARV